jgi:hypothetical protein
MDYTYLFWAMIIFTIVTIVGALFVANRLDKKSKGN